MNEKNQLLGSRPSSMIIDDIGTAAACAHSEHIRPVDGVCIECGDIVESIIRDVCELDPANPNLNDTLCVDVSDLLVIVTRHVNADAIRALKGTPAAAVAEIGGHRDLIAALRSQAQIDADGTMVGVSREAIEEAIRLLSSPQQARSPQPSSAPAAAVQSTEDVEQLIAMAEKSGSSCVTIKVDYLRAVISRAAALPAHPRAWLPIIDGNEKRPVISQFEANELVRMGAVVVPLYEHQAAPVVNQRAKTERPVYKLRVRGRIHDYTPTEHAFDLPDGEHELFLAAPAPVVNQRVTTEQAVDAPYLAERLKDHTCRRVDDAGGTPGLTLYFTKLGAHSEYQLYRDEAIALWMNLGAALGRSPQAAQLSVNAGEVGNQGEYRRGLMEAFHLANMTNANRQRRTAEETCSHLVRCLGELANGLGERSASGNAGEVDAARYRGIRAGVLSEWGNDISAALHWMDARENDFTPAQFDRAIDAAIAAMSKEQK